MPESMTLMNTWIQSLSIHPPPLLVAVDDALVALAERALQLMQMPAPSAAPKGGGVYQPASDDRNFSIAGALCLYLYNILFVSRHEASDSVLPCVLLPNTHMQASFGDPGSPSWQMATPGQ